MLSVCECMSDVRVCVCVCVSPVALSQEKSSIKKSKGRKIFLNAFQEKKREVIKHTFVGEKMHIGILFHIQALLLARFIRGDIDEYPPYFWR